MNREERPVTTPYRELLISEMSQTFELFYQQFLASSRQRWNAIASIDSEINASQRNIERCREELRRRELPLTATDLLPRSPDEVGRDEDWLRYRRESNRRWHFERAREKLSQAIDAMELLIRRREQACQDLEQELDDWRERARQLVNLYRLRINTYWDGVLRTHVDGRHLAPMLGQAEVPLPTWALQPVAPVRAIAAIGDGDDSNDLPPSGDD